MREAYHLTQYFLEVRPRFNAVGARSIILLYSCPDGAVVVVQPRSGRPCVAPIEHFCIEIRNRRHSDRDAATRTKDDEKLLHAYDPGRYNPTLYHDASRPTKCAVSFDPCYGPSRCTSVGHR
jgi:hypothetical protein